MTEQEQRYTDTLQNLVDAQYDSIERSKEYIKLLEARIAELAASPCHEAKSFTAAGCLCVDCGVMLRHRQSELLDDYYW